MTARYSSSFKERALGLVAERLEAEDQPSVYAATNDIAARLGVAAESLRRWMKQADIDGGRRDGVSSDTQAELRRLKRENAELRRANEILRTASAFFAAELDRPTTR